MSAVAYVVLGLAITLAVVGVVLGAGASHPEVAARGRDRLGADDDPSPHDRLLLWAQALPALTGFWYPVLPSRQLDDEAVVSAETWEGCVLVFVGEARGSLTLDCVVPAAGDAEGLLSPALVPVTIVVRRSIGRHGSEGALTDLRAWASAGARVDIEFDRLGLVHVRRGAISATGAMVGERPSRQVPSSGV